MDDADALNDNPLKDIDVEDESNILGDCDAYVNDTCTLFAFSPLITLRIKMCPSNVPNRNYVIKIYFVIIVSKNSSCTPSLTDLGELINDDLVDETKDGPIDYTTKSFNTEVDGKMTF